MNKTTKKTERDARGRMVEKEVADKDVIILHNVVLSPEGFYREATSPLVLKKYVPPKDDEASATINFGVTGNGVGFCVRF